MVTIRPGPNAIPPGCAPGGVVLHVYSVPDGQLLAVQFYRKGHDPEPSSDEVTRLVVGAGISGVVLVGYSGDSGQRLPWTGERSTRFDFISGDDL